MNATARRVDASGLREGIGVLEVCVVNPISNAVATHACINSHVTIFRELAMVHAWLVAELWLDLHDSVDLLQILAEQLGLVDEIGQDAVQAIMANAFDIEAS